MFKKQNRSAGFTLLELVIVIAVTLALLAFATINLFNLPSATTIDTASNTLVEDIKTQQIKAMVGDTEGRGVPDTYGIYFMPTSYVFFHGAAYIANSPDNFTSSLASGYTITTTFPSSTLVFNKGSGEIVNFSNTQDSITVTDGRTGKQKTMVLNKYGTIVDMH